MIALSNYPHLPFAGPAKYAQLTMTRVPRWCTFTSISHERLCVCVHRNGRDPPSQRSIFLRHHPELKNKLRHQQKLACMLLLAVCASDVWPRNIMQHPLPHGTHTHTRARSAKSIGMKRAPFRRRALPHMQINIFLLLKHRLKSIISSAQNV